MLVDTIDDTAGNRYSGMPGRLYVIDREGKVAFKSGRGPYLFKPAELEQSLVLLLQEGPVRENQADALTPGGGQLHRQYSGWCRARARRRPRMRDTFGMTPRLAGRNSFRFRRKRASTSEILRI